MLTFLSRQRAICHTHLPHPPIYPTHPAPSVVLSTVNPTTMHETCQKSQHNYFVDNSDVLFSVKKSHAEVKNAVSNFTVVCVLYFLYTVILYRWTKYTSIAIRIVIPRTHLFTLNIKVSSYITQYLVLRIAQSALYLTSLADLFNAIPWIETRIVLVESTTLYTLAIALTNILPYSLDPSLSSSIRPSLTPHSLPSSLPPSPLFPHLYRLLSSPLILLCKYVIM